LKNLPGFELARLLIKHKISGVPVVDEEKNLLGIITEKDLINQNKRLHIPTVIKLFDAYFVLGSSRTEGEIKKMVATTVDEIYTRKALTVEEGTSLQEVATIMYEKEVHTLPVLRGKEIVGIIGKADIVRAMTRDVPEQKRE
jgi:CBS domain-containing protein